MHFDFEQQYSRLCRDLSVSTSFYKHVLCRPANKKSVIFPVFVSIHKAQNIF